ncbi:hypothetical protein VB796_14265 [Arcicella sp. LKC2W]|uniref:TPR end-of-group domain-containing protein n=1 Tax=Arcicella sp. LKC2W TaxID=2984198 RepID=UPI002B1EFFE7|nr:hypothetical protein [Arcicella sp. LKC2W]MEA5460218.1 hypothetical protein [Arcicella sp. LKC2W]
MNKNSIEYLAYLLDKAKQDRKDNAIVFLGAGASVSAGIPLTHVIVRHIKLKFRKNPIIKQNTSNDYYQLMGALTADERRDLFHDYVTRDKVKLNIANVYLAQLLKLGYVDYIVTVNFDDLILKACTLFNFLPPVYDISNIKTITTTDIRTNSVIYLHGQYFGQWLLNNEEELIKVEDEILNLFNTIKTRRTWVVIGYSGNDGIFEKIKALGSFSNDLFWVKKQLNAVDDKHVIDFLETPNVNAHKIEGYYADSFFLKLHAELNRLDPNLKAPDIFYKPFSFLKSMMQSVNELNENDDLSKQTANLIKVCNSRISKAIDTFENERTIEALNQNIIDAYIKGDFSEEQAKEFENEIITHNYIDAKEELSEYFNNWGNSLSDLAKLKRNESLFLESFEKYQKASELNPNNGIIYNNWGCALSDLAKQKGDESLFLESIEKYKKASELNLNNVVIYSNWGNTLLQLFRLKGGEQLLIKAEEVLKKGIELGGGVYNLACLFAVRKDKNNALAYLEKSLINKGISIKHIEDDDDWKDLKTDIDFMNLLNKYR